MHWFPHVVNNLTLYDLVSGWIPCAALVTGVAGIFRHWQCEKENCHKLGHRHPDHGRPVCRDHYHHDIMPPK